MAGTIDPTGRVIGELRTAAAAWPAPHTDVPVIGGELDATLIPDGAGAPRAIVVRRLPSQPWGRLAVRTVRYMITCYDPDLRLASVLAGLVSEAIHNAGPRVAGGVGIYRSTEVSTSGSIVEPDTRYPLERLSVEVIAAATSVA